MTLKTNIQFLTPCGLFCRVLHICVMLNLFQHLLGYQMFFESSGICVDTKESLSIIKVKRLLWKYLKIKN
jgi:hypothetical protein